MWIKSSIIVLKCWIFIFLFLKRYRVQRKAKMKSQINQSTDSLELLLITDKDFTEIRVGNPYRTQNRREGGLKKKKRQGWSKGRKGGLEWFGLTLLPTVRQLVEIVLWNGNWAIKKKEKSKQKGKCNTQLGWMHKMDIKTTWTNM